MDLPPCMGVQFILIPLRYLREAVVLSVSIIIDYAVLAIF